MLKGQKVWTDDYFGTVLNDAEHEQVLILRAIRSRWVRHNDRNAISLIAGVPATESGWKVVDYVVAIPWAAIRSAVIWPNLPKSLYARRITRW